MFQHSTPSDNSSTREKIISQSSKVRAVLVNLPVNLANHILQRPLSLIKSLL
jgi:hypothetical protein